VAHGTGGGEERRDAYMVLLEKSEGKKIENWRHRSQFYTCSKVLLHMFRPMYKQQSSGAQSTTEQLLCSSPYVILQCPYIQSTMQFSTHNMFWIWNRDNHGVCRRRWWRRRYKFRKEILINHNNSCDKNIWYSITTQIYTVLI
jgi:hypothetical protein